MMMETRGISAENNSLVQNIFMNYGLSGLIGAKLLLIIVPLIIASTVVKNSYWVHKWRTCLIDPGWFDGHPGKSPGNGKSAVHECNGNKPAIS